MEILQETSKQVDVSQDLDNLQLPKSNSQNPLWHVIKSTAKRAHQSWESTLEEGMKKHQNAISGVVQGAQNIVNQSVQNATNAYETVATETQSGIHLVRQSLGLKAATDELERELKLNESILGGSPAITPEQRTVLTKLARTEQQSLQTHSNTRLEDILTKNADLSTDRQTIQAELKAIGQDSINAVTKLRMDIRAVRSQVEHLNRTGQPVDVATVFDAVRKTQSNPTTDRSRIVALLVGQSVEPTTAISKSAIPPEPDLKSSPAPQSKPTLQIAPQETPPTQDHTDILATLQDFSKTRLRRIATAINGRVGEADKISKVRSREKDNILEVLGTPQRLSFLAQNRDLIEGNLTATAATTIKGDKVTTSKTKA